MVAIANASPIGDSAPALISLDSSLIIEGKKTRIIKLKDFLKLNNVSNQPNDSIYTQGFIENEKKIMHFLAKYPLDGTKNINAHILFNDFPNLRYQLCDETRKTKIFFPQFSIIFL